MNIWNRAWAGALIVAIVALCTGCPPAAKPGHPATSTDAVTLIFSLARYPDIADHVRDAQAAGESAVCTIDRPGATERRKESLRGHATALGKDRDEYPPAECKEGGKGADVRLVPSSENRSAGAWMSGQLRKWPNGTQVLLVVGK